MNTNNNTTSKQATPKLVCQVTGKTRVTNQKYLASKAEKKNITVEEFLETYVSKDAVRQLKAGRTVSQIRESVESAPDNEISTEFVEKVIQMNGKSGPSGPHRPRPSTPIVQISPEIERLVKTVAVRERETVEIK
jgi:hypothetical protein